VLGGTIFYSLEEG
jgi:hypothetical protein